MRDIHHPVGDGTAARNCLRCLSCSSNVEEGVEPPTPELCLLAQEKSVTGTNVHTLLGLGMSKYDSYCYARGREQGISQWQE